MFDFSNPAFVLQLLDKKKLHVLIALFCLPLPTSELDVAALVGCNRKTARETLMALRVLGLVERSGFKEKSPWTLTSEAHQLPLPLKMLNGNSMGTAVLEDGSDFGEGKNYPHQVSATTTLNKEERSAAAAALAGNGVSEGKNYPHGKRLTSKVGLKPGLMQALEESKIGRNMWEELAGYEWVTAEYVTAHSQLRRENHETIGLQIHRMREGDAMPIFEDVSGCPHCGRRLDDFGRCICAVIRN